LPEHNPIQCAISPEPFDVGEAKEKEKEKERKISVTPIITETAFCNKH